GTGPAGRPPGRERVHGQPGHGGRGGRRQQSGCTVHCRFPTWVQHRDLHRDYRCRRPGADPGSALAPAGASGDAVAYSRCRMSDIFGEAASWLSTSANWSGDDGVPHRLIEHVGYTALTVGVAAAIALPLGLWIGHTGRLRTVAIALTGALRALPTLGVLTLMVLWRGIGLTPAIVSLVVLAIPPLLAGAYAGLESVDRATIDAARAIGMTEWQ